MILGVLNDQRILPGWPGDVPRTGGIGRWHAPGNLPAGLDDALHLDLAAPRDARTRGRTRTHARGTRVLAEWGIV